MAFLRAEREALETLIPGLDDALLSAPLETLEAADSPAIAMARDAGAASLVVPRELGGKGATALEAARVHRAIGSRSPSLAVALTMHNFSVATFVAYHLYGSGGKELLAMVASEGLLIASGFAEGRPGASILDSKMTARPVPGGYIVSGSKKPCSLSRSMGVLTAGVRVEGGAGQEPRRAVAIVPADADGLELRKFWGTWILQGAESDEVILRDVRIPESFLFFPEATSGLDPAEVGGFCWFELLASSAYLGAASALVERVFEGDRGSDVERAMLGVELESAASAIEGFARELMDGVSDGQLPRALFVRYSVQRAIERASSLAAEILGGQAYIKSSEVSYLLAASRALAFHPPSRTSVAGALSGYLAGQPFRAV